MSVRLSLAYLLIHPDFFSLFESLHGRSATAHFPLMPIIRQKVKPDSVVYTDTFRSYNALDVSEFKHYRINHSELFANKHNHINGIENFWNQAKLYLRRFNGIPREHFHLFLKECEWRFNNSDPKNQLKQWVKKEMG